jgi:hypothetical protein
LLAAAAQSMDEKAAQNDSKLTENCHSFSAGRLKTLGKSTNVAHFLLCSGGLEPVLRVLFSAIFHEFRSGISIGVAICGNEWNQNGSFFVVNLPTKFSGVSTMLPSMGI